MNIFKIFFLTIDREEGEMGQGGRLQQDVTVVV